jgi:predicted TIM-barrel fold metal-dependent hydrolase
VHFWDHAERGLTWSWLERGFDHPRLKGTYRLDAPRYATSEFLAESAGSGVVATVHIQAAAWSDQPQRETEWLDRVAAATGWPQAIVGGVRLVDADAARVVMAHRAASGLFRGVRDLAVPASSLDDEELVSRYAELAPLAGTVELMVTHEHFPKLARLADRAPSAVVVLGHAGLPVERTPSYRAAWHRDLRTLATKPNVVCKISALASASDPNWTVESLRPWVLGCVEAFGPQRSILATNWPIDRLHGTYIRLVDAYRGILAELTAEERADILHGTAERVYQLAPAAYP